MLYFFHGSFQVLPTKQFKQEVSAGKLDQSFTSPFASIGEFEFVIVGHMRTLNLIVLFL